MWPFGLTFELSVVGLTSPNCSRAAVTGVETDAAGLLELSVEAATGVGPDSDPLVNGVLLVDVDVEAFCCLAAHALTVGAGATLVTTGGAGGVGSATDAATGVDLS